MVKGHLLVPSSHFAGLMRYGGSKILNEHGSADGWKSLMRHLVANKAGKLIADSKSARIGWHKEGDLWLEKIHVSEVALKAYRECPNL